MATVQKLDNVDPSEFVQQAAAMRPMISAAADETEKNRRVSQDIFDDIRDRGFFRFYQPERFGGLEFDDPSVPMKCVLEWSSADTSTGWV